MTHSVDNIVKFNIHQEHVRDVRNTLHVRFVRLVYIDICRLRLVCAQGAFVLKQFSNMIKDFLEARRVSGMGLICFE